MTPRHPSAPFALDALPWSEWEAIASALWWLGETVESLQIQNATDTLRDEIPDLWPPEPNDRHPLPRRVTRHQKRQRRRNRDPDL